MRRRPVPAEQSAFVFPCAITANAEGSLVLYFDPEAQSGMRPTRACARRYLWFRDERLSLLLAGVSNDFEMRHYSAAVLENPARIAAMMDAYLSAWRFEVQTFGNAAAHLVSPASNLLRRAVAA